MDKELYTDTLFVGLTRPPTILGIPYVAFVMEVMIVTLVFLAIGNPFYLSLIIPIHAILYLISSNDPGIFDSIYVWFITVGRCKNTKFWGAASFSPLTVKKEIK